MKQLINIPQGESHLIGGQWYNQGEHEVDVPDPLEGLKQPEEAANLDLPPGDASSVPTPARRGKKADAPIPDAPVQPENVEASAPAPELPPENQSETKE